MGTVPEPVGQGQSRELRDWRGPDASAPRITVRGARPLSQRPPGVNPGGLIACEVGYGVRLRVGATLGGWAVRLALAHSRGCRRGGGSAITHAVLPASVADPARAGEQGAPRLGCTGRPPNASPRMRAARRPVSAATAMARRGLAVRSSCHTEPREASMKSYSNLSKPNMREQCR